jgi:hypothetical protein
MKTCKKCLLGFAESEFPFCYKGSRLTSNRRGTCIKCVKQYQLEYRQKNRELLRVRNLNYCRLNKEKRNATVKRVLLASRNRNKAIIHKLKSVPCTDCKGLFPPEAMDFDHLRDKITTIAHLAGGARAVSVVLAEVAKCEVVCSNCHRVRTARRRANGR